MAVSKVILNSTTLIDTTDKTVTAGSMLSGITALKNDGTTATGNIASKTSSDLTASNLTVTAPAGYYASAATKTLSDENLVAGNVKKDVTIFDVTGSYEGSGGGGGMTLLGSGEYVKATGTASIDIPVSYTGTPKEYYYYNTTPLADTAQTIMGYNRILDNNDLSNYLPSGNLICAHRTRNASNAYLWSASAQVITLTSTTMSSGRPGAGVNHQAGTWKWFIYGEAAT